MPPRRHFRVIRQGMLLPLSVRVHLQDGVARNIEKERALTFPLDRISRVRHFIRHVLHVRRASGGFRTETPKHPLNAPHL